MAQEKHLGAVKRFGARYGKKVRDKLAKIESIQKVKHKCPYCNYITAKRVSIGIFECLKCSSKFTGRAYQPLKRKISKKIVVKETSFEGGLFKKSKQYKELKGQDANIDFLMDHDSIT